MSFGQTQTQAQRQVMSQSQRQSLEILQMPLPELQAYLQEAVLSNPLLELELPAESTLPAPEAEQENDAEAEGERWEVSYSESAAAWADQGPAGDWDGPEEYRDPLAGQERLADALHEQLLRLPRLTEQSRNLCDYLVECLSENGFLEFDLADLAAEQGVPLFDMEQALYVLQGLTPAGVAARSLTECLVLQLERTVNFNAHTLCLVQQGLPLLAKNDLPALAKLLGCKPEQARAAAGAVRALNPRPAGGYGEKANTAYLTPEAVLRKENHSLAVEFNQQNLPALRIDNATRDLLRQTGGNAEREYLKTNEAAARQLMRSLSERQTTLARVIERLAKVQAGFFLRGEPLAPFTLTQLAEQLGVSLSTVSRAVQGKSILFEGHSLLLKGLFTAPLAAADGREVSSESIKQQLRRFVEAENAAHPLSDEALCAALGAVQLPVSRRTVAKYREDLGIPTSARRKKK